MANGKKYKNKLDAKVEFDEEVDEEPSKKKTRTSTIDVFVNGIQTIYNKNYKKVFKDIVWKERRNRIRNLTQQVLACCVDLHKLENERMDYLKGNDELAKDALAIIQLIQSEVEEKLNVNLCTIDNSESYLDPDQRQEREKQLKENIHDFASLIGSISSRDNSRTVKKQFTKMYPEDAKLYPSEYILEKENQIDILPIIIEGEKDLDEVQAIDDSYNNLATNKKNDEEMEQIGEVEDVKCGTKKTYTRQLGVCYYCGQD